MGAIREVELRECLNNVFNIHDVEIENDEEHFPDGPLLEWSADVTSQRISEFVQMKNIDLVSRTI